MTRSKVSFLRWSIILIDLFLIIDSFFFAYYIRNKYFHENFGLMYNFNRYIPILFIAVPLWLIIMDRFGLYNFKYSQRIFTTVLKLFLTVGLGIVLISAMLFFIGDSFTSRLFLGIFAVMIFTLISTERILLKIALRLWGRNKKNHIKVLVIGTNSLAGKFSEYINENPQFMVDIIGYIQASDIVHSTDINILGKLDELDEILKKNVVDEVVFALPKDYIGDVEPHVLKCESMGITVNMVADLFNLELSKVKIAQIGTLPVITFHTVSFDFWQLFLKRTLDIIGACIGLIITGITFVVVAPIIYLESPGPIFFSQNRVGKNGRIFKCYKFRSMYMDAEERKKELMKLNEMNGAMFKIKDDPRVTKVGKLIRATSIDELPQFWNVLKGDMSLVGTRPPTMDEVETYENYHWRRLSIKPGITGMWQVKGRNSIQDFEDIVKLDTTYIDNWSIWLDLKLLFKTVQIVVMRSGAY